MKTKKLMVLTGSLIAIGCLGGCNKTEDNSIKVLFWHTFGDKIETAIKKKANAFVKLVKDNEGVDVKVELSHLGGYNDVKRIVGTALSAGNGPTMTISYADSVAGLMAMEPTKGAYIVNADTLMNDAEIGFGTDAYLGDTRKGTSDFITSYLEEGQQFDREGTYVMPYMKSSEIMLYNKEAALLAMTKYTKTKSLTDPEKITFLENMSFTELMELAEVCVENKKDLGFTSMEYPVFYDSDSNMLITQIEQLGLEYSYRDQDNKVVLGLDAEADLENATEVKALLQKYYDWHTRNGTATNKNGDFGLITTKQTEGTYASDSFKNQKCFFTIGSSGGAGYSFPQTGQFTCGVCRVPYMGESYDDATFISQGPSIAFLNDKSLSSEMNATRLKYGWKFYKYITNTNNNVELCVNGSEGYVPVRESCYQSELWAEFLEEDTDYARSAKVLKEKINGKFLSSLVFNGSATYREQMTGLVGDAMKGKNLDQAMANAVTNTKNAMK